MRENLMSGSMGGRWRRGSPAGHLRVPGRCAEKRHHDGLVGTQPADNLQPRQRSTLLRYGVSSATFAYLDHFTWHRVLQWLRHKHRRSPWTLLRRRYLPGWRPTEGKATLFRPREVATIRYLYRGAQIASPWTSTVKASTA